jgi:hypothetical protein
MANNRCTYQQEHTVSIRRDKLIEIATNEELSKKDYKVLLMLLTQLNGWCMPPSGKGKDPMNYMKLDMESIANTLGLKKKEVKASIENIMDEYLIETGDSDTVINGYRFTF